MNEKNLIGAIEPLADDTGDACGWHFSGERLKMTGLIVTATHPTKITVTDSTVTFDYTVGGKAVSRSYALAKSDGKIVSFTNPDGTVTEVVHNG